MGEELVMTIIFNLMAAVAGAGAAWYWFLSSTVAYPPRLHGSALIGGQVNINMNPLLEAVQKNGRLNAIAARWSAAAAFFVASSAIIEMCSHATQ